MSKQRNIDTLSTRDADDLESYCEQLASLALHGQSMEPVTFGGEPPTTPKWMTSLSRNSDTALARGIAERLRVASETYAPAGAVLVAMHDPAAVICDGKSSLTEEELDRCKRDPTFRVREKLDAGRRLAVYPMTWAADEARRWAATALERKACLGLAKGLTVACGGTLKGGKQKQEPLERVAEFLALRGHRPTDAISRMVDAKRNSRGDVAELWRQIDTEAESMVVASIRAWNETPNHRVERGAKRMLTDRLVSGVA